MWTNSATYDAIEFAKLDVDELNDTTAKAGVRVRDCTRVAVSVVGVVLTAVFLLVQSMPTFFFFEDGTLQRQLSVRCSSKCFHPIDAADLSPAIVRVL